MTTETRIESLENQVKLLKRLLRWTWIGWGIISYHPNCDELNTQVPLDDDGKEVTSRALWLTLYKTHSTHLNIAGGSAHLMQDKAIDLTVVISHEGQLGIHHLVEEFIIAGRENWKRWLSVSSTRFQSLLVPDSKHIIGLDTTTGRSHLSAAARSTCSSEPDHR